VELVIQVTPELGEELARPIGTPGDSARAITERLRQAGVTLVSQGDPPEFFSVEVPDKATGDELAADLQAIDGVEAAYVKPDIRPPR
jgi:hypothetical protein